MKSNRDRRLIIIYVVTLLVLLGLVVWGITWTGSC